MDAKYLAEIKAREQAATPGPWNVGDSSEKAFMAGKNAVVSPLRVIVDRAVYSDSEEFNEFDKQTYADISFIAHARTDIPVLVAEVERLTEEKNAIEKEYRHYRRISEKADQQIATLKKALKIVFSEFGRYLPHDMDYYIKQAQEQEGKT